MPHYQKLYTRAPRKPRGRHGSGEGRKGYLATILVLACILLPLLARVHLDRETLRQGRAWEARKAELRDLIQKTENLRVERESYLRGDYVRARAAQLGLRPALPGQVRFMTLKSDAEIEEEVAAAAVAGNDVP